MRNRSIKLYQTLGIIFLTSLLIVALIITFISDANKDHTIANPYLLWTVEHHAPIMIILVIISIIFGFFWSSVLFSEVQKKDKLSHKAKEVFLQLLGKDERVVLEYLYKNNGFSTQAQISKIPSMNKVKAFRTLQKIKLKEIIDIETDGKVRVIKVKPSILSFLQE